MYRVCCCTAVNAPVFVEDVLLAGWLGLDQAGGVIEMGPCPPICGVVETPALKPEIARLVIQAGPGLRKTMLNYT
jgi:hypothetical protein